jgi:putative transposase
VGKNPTDRGTLGTKRSVLTDGHGLPLSVAVDGANRHDMKLVETTLEAAHIRHRGEEAQAKREIPGYRARRWVVERTHAWMNRFRRLLIRWEKKVENYLALLHFACAWITFQAAELFG